MTVSAQDEDISKIKAKLKVNIQDLVVTVSRNSNSNDGKLYEKLKQANVQLNLLEKFSD